jgi:hypothetical protein
MDVFLDILLLTAQVLVFVGPLALVTYYLREKLGLTGRENQFGAPPSPSSPFFRPKVIVSVWVIALALMLYLEWWKS